MSASTAWSSAVPVDFFCEHAATKSRVYALLERSGHHSALQAVLTCSGPTLAESAAGLLSRVAGEGDAPDLQGRVQRLAASMPAPVAASFREAVDRTRAGVWPVSDHAHQPLPPEPTGRPADADGGGAGRTPPDVRLADLPGAVVRLVRLVELHVHDAERLLAKARAAGWSPLSAGELSADDPRDLVGAAMFLTDDAPDIAGTDPMADLVEGELLSADRGDEVVAWSAAGVTARFAGGGQLLAEDGRSDSRGRRPAFSTLFPVQPADDEEGLWRLTPRTAALLHAALRELAEDGYEDVTVHGDAPTDPDAGQGWLVFGRLPRLSWRQDAVWRRQVARAADDLADDIEAGRWPHPRTNAEELMLHLAIDDARERAADPDDDERPDLDLPSHPDDYDWDMCVEALFQDTDILLLDEAWADGVEDPDGDINRDLGIGDLRPDNWLRYFDNVDPRDPHRPLR